MILSSNLWKLCLNVLLNIPINSFSLSIVYKEEHLTLTSNATLPEVFTTCMGLIRKKVSGDSVSYTFPTDVAWAVIRSTVNALILIQDYIFLKTIALEVFVDFMKYLLKHLLSKFSINNNFDVINY